MVKKSLLIMMLLAVFMPWAAMAQSPLTIGEGTSYSSTSDGQGSPMGRTYYYKSAAQFIYTASELASMGGAKAITSVAFYHNAYSFTDDVKIYLAHTTATTVDANNPATTATEVYYKTSVTVGGSTAGWQTFEFDSPFNYNGTDNLLVIVCRTKSTGYSSNQAWQYTETTDNKFMCRHADNTAYANIANTSYSYTASTKRPNIQIAYEEPATCFKPQNLQATLTPGNGTIATLTWERNASGTEDAWVLEYGTASDFTGATSVNVTGGTPTKDLSGLTAETKYYARVKPDCDTDGTKWSDVCSFTPTNALTVTVGDETATSSNAPIRSGSGSQSEFVYPASMLTALNGKTLTSVKFYASTTTASYTNNVTVYMQEVAGTTESTSAWLYDQSTATKVYEGTTLAVADGEMVITFSTPYEYAGGNLCFNIWAETSAPSVTWKGFNPGYASCGYDYYITPPVSNPYSTAQFLPKATFAYESNAYPKPKNLAVTNLTANGATITWEAPNTDVTGYKYQYREAGGTWNDLTSTTALSAPLTGLTSNTTYEFQVQALYAGDNESGFASTTFSTEIAIPYEYGFEDATEFGKWEMANDAGNMFRESNNNINSYLSTTGVQYTRTGDYLFAFWYYDYPDTNPAYQTLISPKLTGIANGLHVEFYYKTSGSYQETFRVGYSTTDKQLSSFNWGSPTTSSETDYQLFKANYPAETKYIAIQHMSDDKYFLLIDDFSFTEAPDCLEPHDVLANNITTTSADVTWTNGGEETAWDIYVTTDATDVPDDETSPTYANTSIKPYPLASLTPATSYYVYVRAACGSTETSDWSTAGVFATECEKEVLPYSYNFDDPSQFNNCWNVINTYDAYDYVNVITPSGTNNCLAFYFGSSTAATLAAILPEFDDSYSLNECEITFDACYNGSNMSSGKLLIGIMTDPADFTTFELVKELTITDVYSTWGSHKVRLNTYTGSGQYIAIQNIRTKNGYVLVDNLEVNPLPSCLEPEGLAVSNETAHGATFSWTAGAATQNAWQLYFSKTNAAPADDETNVTDADSNPFTVESGLDAETNYYVWVRANCGGTDGFSIWVGPETFTTGIACPAPTGLAANNLTNHTADLSWNGTSESYNVMYRTAVYMSNPVLNEEFKNSTFPSTWSRSSTALTDDVLNGTTTINSVTSGWGTTTYGLGQYNVKMNIYSTYKYWLITKNITLGNNSTLNFDAAITAYNSNSAPTAVNVPDANSRFVVLITTDNQATWTILREWNNTGSADVLNNISNTGNNFSIDLSSYAGETVKIAFYGGQTVSGPDCDLHIDNVIIGEAVAAGTWQTVYPAPTASPCTITGLLADRKYEAKVQGDCGSEGLSQETTSIFFTTDIACPNPTDLQVVEGSIKSSQVDLTWESTYGELWEVTYWPTNNPDNTTTYQADQIPYTLSGLNPETEYTVKVRAWCGDDDDWSVGYSNEVTFSTIAPCSAQDPEVINITHHNATVTWTGESADGFTVYYRTAEQIDGISEDFSSTPENWTQLSGALNDDGTGPTNTGSGWSFGTNNFTNRHAYMNIYSTWKYWLVTPSIEIGNNYVLNFDAAYTKYNSTSAPDQNGTDDRFVVLISIDNKAHWTSLREWNNAGTGDAVLNDLPVTFQPVSTIDLSAYKGKTVYIAFYGASTTSNTDNHLRIDNVTIGVPMAAGTWQTETAASDANSADLSNLDAGLDYEVFVSPNCDNTIKSDTITFTTVSDNKKYFITAGNWCEDTNWMDGEIPALTDDVIIRTNDTIESGCVAYANKITFENSAKLTIADGGQLITNTAVTATVQKVINAHGATTADGGWYFIASPINNSYLSPTSAGLGLITDQYGSSIPEGQSATYDLYRFNQNPTEGDDGTYKEWINYRKTPFTYFVPGQGYLYASLNGTTLNFTGSIRAYTQEGVGFGLSYYDTNPDASMHGWNLVGNPYTFNAAVDKPYYTLNENGTAIPNTTTQEPVPPCTGILVKATGDNQTVTFSKPETDGSAPSNGNLNIALTQANVRNNSIMDKAIISFNEGNDLSKFYFGQSNAYIYIPQDNKKFAIVSSEGEGEMPLNFRANENGSYTLNFGSQNVSFSYLHLIDNLTGNDIDLLQTPSYTFNATTTDYSSRFKLVFCTGINNDSDSFAFFSNGNWIIGNEGEATLQVVDVTGRVLSSETVNGSVSKAINAAPGVYMIRLINGENVKVQKIVVR